MKISKNKSGLTFLSIVILLQIGCGIREHESEATYRLINDSDHVITLNFSDFDYGEGDDKHPAYSIVLNKRGDSFEKTAVNRGEITPPPYYVFVCDSLNVVFDNMRETVHSQFDDESSRNLMFADPYNEVKGVYTYAFTNEDYENAELIDPN